MKKHCTLAGAVGLAAAAAIGRAAILATPWRESVEASGRIAPQRWARIRSEAPGVVREVMRKRATRWRRATSSPCSTPKSSATRSRAARLALARERQKLADLELRLRENAILREGAERVRIRGGDRPRRRRSASRARGSRRSSRSRRACSKACALSRPSARRARHGPRRARGTVFRGE